MWRIGRTDTFSRTARRYLRRRPHLHAPFTRTLELLEENPAHPKLRLHALDAKLRGLHAVSVTYQVRLVVEIDETEQTLILVDLGDHDDVYR